MSGRVDIIVLSEIVLNDNNQQTKSWSFFGLNLY